MSFIGSSLSKNSCRSAHSRRREPPNSLPGYAFLEQQRKQRLASPSPMKLRPRSAAMEAGPNFSAPKKTYRFQTPGGALTTPSATPFKTPTAPAPHTTTPASASTTPNRIPLVRSRSKPGAQAVSRYSHFVSPRRGSQKTTKTDSPPARSQPRQQKSASFTTFTLEEPAIEPAEEVKMEESDSKPAGAQDETPFQNGEIGAETRVEKETGSKDAPPEKSAFEGLHESNSDTDVYEDASDQSQTNLRPDESDQPKTEQPPTEEEVTEEAVPEQLSLPKTQEDFLEVLDTIRQSSLSFLKEVKASRSMSAPEACMATADDDESSAFATQEQSDVRIDTEAQTEADEEEKANGEVPLDDNMNISAYVFPLLDSATTQPQEEKVGKAVRAVGESDSQLGIDSIQPPPNFYSSSETSLFEAPRFKSLDILGPIKTLRIQRASFFNGRSSLFDRGTLSTIFSSTLLKRAESRDGAPSLLSHSIYQEDGFYKSRVPLFTVHQTTTKGAGAGGASLEADAGNGVKFTLKHIMHPAALAFSAFGGLLESTGSSNNMVTMECHECGAPDCNLHSATVSVSSGGGVKELGSANFLTCNQTRPVLILQNYVTAERFTIRRNTGQGKGQEGVDADADELLAATSEYLIFSALGLEAGAAYPADEADTSKDKGCVGSISRHLAFGNAYLQQPLFRGPPTAKQAGCKMSAGGGADGTFYVNLHSGLPAETKVLLLAGALLLTNDIQDADK